MWIARTEILPGGRAIQHSIEKDASALCWAEIIHHWQHDARFREFFVTLLKEAPFQAFRWETPAVTKLTTNRPFEFVLLDSPDLAITPDPSDFAEYFAIAGVGEVVEFPNLGGDALLVVPCPLDTPVDYGHLAAFLRNAPAAQQHALWQMAGAAMHRRLGSRPLWLSSAGGGVAWLHLRLDDRPKYYGHTPYRDSH